MGTGLAALAGRARAAAAPSTSLASSARTLLADFLANACAGADGLHAADWRDDGMAGQVALLAMRAHAGDRDDLDWASMTHPGSMVWPVVAALTSRPSSVARPPGRLLVAAAAAGYEVTGATASLLGPAAGRHWHLSAVAGQAGAAACAAVLLRFDDLELAAAIGLALTGAGGLGLTMARRASATGWHRASAAVGGLQAARAVRCGARVPDDLIEARGGVLDAFRNATDPAAPARSLAERAPERVLERTSLRLYPTNGLAQSAVHAAAELRRRRGTTPHSATIRVAASVAAATRPDGPGAPWWDLPRAVSVALLTGDPWTVSSDEAACAARRTGLLDRIEVHASDQPAYSATVAADGDEASVPTPPGYRPLDDLDLARHKWATLAGPDVEVRAERLLAGEPDALLSLFD